MTKRVTVVIKDKSRQHEGLRYSLGLLFEDLDVCMVVLDHEVDGTAEYAENAAFIGELGGTLLSNVEANVARHGFGRTTTRALARRIAESDLLVPF